MYDHTQTGLLHLLLIAVGIGMLAGGWLTMQPVAQTILVITGGLMLLLALCFRQLTVSDEGDRLSICFGPLPLFRRRILYSGIKTAKRGRTAILDGWGIHVSLSGGTTWNLSGFDCVDVHLKKGSRVRIGTDDPRGLEAFLQQRLTQEAA